MDLGILAYHSLPFGGCSGARRKVQLMASRQLMDWMRTRLSSWPRRVFTIAAGDLNSGVGTFRDGTKAECASVGEFHNASQNEAADNFVEMSISLELGVLNTLWRTGGPTYCGLAGHRSTIDHFLVPLSGSECVKKVVTCWKLGRKLQLTRDHLPVLVLHALRMRRVGQKQQRTRWDSDRIAIALQQGSEERESFLKELDENLLEQSWKFEKTFTAPAADDSWELWIQTMVETGKKFFAHTKALHTTEETRRANWERWDLLRRRQRLRQQLGETVAKLDAHSQESWTTLQIRELGRQPNRVQRPRFTDCVYSWQGTGEE